MTAIPAKVWIDNHWVFFSLIIGDYKNLISFLNTNELSFLTTLNIDFTNIPLNLHGKGVSNNLLNYLSNNSNDNFLIDQFLNYFLNKIIIISYSSGKKLNYKLNGDAKWQDMTFSAYSSYIPTTTTTTTAITAMIITIESTVGDTFFNATLSYTVGSSGSSGSSGILMLVDWGDGTTDNYTNDSKKKGGMAYLPDHYYADAGTYIVTLNIPLDNSLYFYFNCADITEIIFPLLPTLETLDISSQSLEVLDATSLTNLNCLYCENSQLRILNVNGLTNLTGLYCANNKLDSSNINTILDNLISFNKSGEYFDSRNQNPIAYADSAKVDALSNIWNTVYADVETTTTTTNPV